jgi:hypothetical protein
VKRKSALKVPEIFLRNFQPELKPSGVLSVGWSEGAMNVWRH